MVSEVFVDVVFRKVEVTKVVECKACQMLDQSTPYIQAAGYLHHSRPVISSGRIQDKLVWLLMCLQGYAATSYQGGLDQSIGARARRTSSHKALHKMSARMSVWHV
jgi:hypothetical protein